MSYSNIMKDIGPVVLKLQWSAAHRPAATNTTGHSKCRLPSRLHSRVRRGIGRGRFVRNITRTSNPYACSSDDEANSDRDIGYGGDKRLSLADIAEISAGRAYNVYTDLNIDTTAPQRTTSFHDDLRTYESVSAENDSMPLSQYVPLSQYMPDTSSWLNLAHNIESSVPVAFNTIESSFPVAFGILEASVPVAFDTIESSAPIMVSAVEASIPDLISAVVNVATTPTVPPPPPTIRLITNRADYMLWREANPIAEYGAIDDDIGGLDLSPCVPRKPIDIAVMLASYGVANPGVVEDACSSPAGTPVPS